MDDRSFQRRVEEWLEACFPPATRNDPQERTYRFLEEALELAQAAGCSQQDAEALVNYVYGRPKGHPELEVGGVIVTLAGFCSTSKIDMDKAGAMELQRNWKRMDFIRNKQRQKRINSPLPQ